MAENGCPLPIWREAWHQAGMSLSNSYEYFTDWVIFPAHCGGLNENAHHISYIWLLGSQYLFHKHQAQKHKEQTGNAAGFWNLKVYPKWHTSSNKAIHPNLSQTVPPNGKQVFKHRTYGGHSHWVMAGTWEDDSIRKVLAVQTWKFKLDPPEHTQQSWVRWHMPVTLVLGRQK